MDDNNKNTNGELNGFDSAENNTEEKGYTVTPEGGFYTKSREDIIQDDSVNTSNNTEDYKTQESSAEAEKNEPPKNNYFPNGQYNSYSQNYSSYSKQYVPKPPKVEKTSRRFGGGIVVVACVLAAIIGAGSATAATLLLNDNKDAEYISPSTTSGQNININIDETAETVVEAVAEKVTPSVVGIRTTTSVMNFFGNSSEATGSGSGVIYSSDGYIITNYHVISGATSNKSGSKIEVFTDALTSKSYEAKVVGYNISSDLAVIKIEAKGLKAVEFADSSKLKVGQYVITVGNPGGLEFMDSVTYGVVSGLDRIVSANSSVSLIQTDAAINPGNSGGALVNAKGKLVGINSSKIVSEEYEGMGFAIPSNTVAKICKKIIEKQNDPEPYIGISLSDKYTASVLKYYGFPAGAVVLSVSEGSPAESAGLAKGDIITEFNGKEIDDYNKLNDLMKDTEPNSTVSVKLYRSGRYYTTDIKVGSNNAVD